MDKIYGRYMVFVWDEYEASHPLDGVIDFDSLDEAEIEAGKQLDAGERNVMIFDRVKGGMVSGQWLSDTGSKDVSRAVDYRSAP